jgi:S-adenosylmethionine:tRNA-ribosyltransferase-isomerase (queuine synthetase)
MSNDENKMNAFITLTKINKTKVRININHICFYELEQDEQFNGYKKVTFIAVGTTAIRVLETVEQIDHKKKRVVMQTTR